MRDASFGPNRLVFHGMELRRRARDSSNIDGWRIRTRKRKRIVKHPMEVRLKQGTRELPREFPRYYFNSCNLLTYSLLMASAEGTASDEASALDSASV